METMSIHAGIWELLKMPLYAPAVNKASGSWMRFAAGQASIDAVRDRGGCSPAMAYRAHRILRRLTTSSTPGQTAV